MSSLFVDGSVTWELVNIGNSGSSGGSGGGGGAGFVGRTDFTDSDWLPNGDNYELAMTVGYVPVAVIDSNNNSVLFDISGNRIVLGAPISGYYLYTTSEG